MAGLHGPAHTHLSRMPGPGSQMDHGPHMFSCKQPTSYNVACMVPATNEESSACSKAARLCNA
jgi:hypothetical protein